ncbi:insecticidal delta-endotoxin Cry8Ea1 family protein [Bacillus thuringiensis]|uniref:insecticidal delta-endotoxin Cry8Ea1 family protein n=1 Tax=Bacillus thuringiensis TaxID=1428 RepID=UPI0009AB1148
MNSYQNKNENEHEILDASQNNTNMPNRYPFANDRNMFTMSWNNCQGSTWQQTWESVQSIITIGVYLIQFAAAPSIGGIPILLSIINKLIPSSGQSVAALSICDLLSIIRKEVDDSVLNDGVADFNGKLTNYKEYYLASLNEWLKAGKPNDNRLRNVVDYFKKSEEGFNEILAGSLSRQNAQILLLPTFVQAANVQLLLLRDAVQYKKEWGALLSAEKVGLELISPTIDYGQRLKEKIAQYTNHCVYWYQTGLNQIKQAGTSAEIWSKFNKFRREMTLAVLDVISIFSTYDFDKYPFETNIELTREIYTDPVGYSLGTYSWLNNWPGAFNGLEANGTRADGLVTWLLGIGIYSESVSQYFGGWVGTLHSEYYTGSNTTLNRMSGTISNNYLYFNFYYTDVFKIASLGIMNLAGETSPRPEYRVSRAEFHNSRPYTEVYNANNNGLSRMTIESMLPGVKNPGPSYTDYAHRLSNAACVQYGTSRINVYGWTHTSMKRENQIYPNKITQIPAVKGNSLQAGKATSGPGHTGGNLVNMFYASTLSMNCYFSQPLIYRMRIRYSTSFFTPFYISSPHHSGVVSMALPQTNYVKVDGQTIYVDLMDARAFQIIEVPVEFRATSSGYVNLSFSANASYGVFIDKIEFIPINIKTLEYEGSRNLEKTKKAVNDLFIN